jgi:hypothetical protein
MKEAFEMVERMRAENLAEVARLSQLSHDLKQQVIARL